MPEYTSNWGLPYPVSTDLIASLTENLRISLQDIATKTDQGLTAAVGQAVDEVQPMIEAVRYVHPTTPEFDNADDMTATDGNGWWVVGGSGLPGLPFEGAGQVLLLTTSQGPAFQEAVQYATGATYRRAITNPYVTPKVWGAWRRVDSDDKGTVPDSTDLNSLNSASASGRYALAQNYTYSNMPFTGAGQLRVDVMGQGPGFQEAVQYATGATYRRPITNPFSTPKVWGEWSEFGASGGAEVSSTPTLPDPNAPLEADLSTITMWGDSLTHAGGVAQRLRDLAPGVTVNNRGASGQNSAHISGRQGGNAPVMTTVTGVIPESGGVTIDTRTVNILVESGYPARSLTGYFAGVHGTLSVPSGSTTHTFTRTSAGTPVDVSAGAAFWTDHAIEARRGAQVIWMGRNNLGTALPTEYLPKMIDFISPARKRVVVLSVTNSPDEGIGTERYELFQAVNEQLRVMAGECFLDVRRYMIDHGLDAVGITPTTEDAAAVAADCIPPSLTSDGIHFTGPAQSVIGDWLHSELSGLGWWE